MYSGEIEYKDPAIFIMAEIWDANFRLNGFDGMQKELSFVLSGRLTKLSSILNSIKWEIRPHFWLWTCSWQ